MCYNDPFIKKLGTFFLKKKSPAPFKNVKKKKKN